MTEFTELLQDKTVSPNKILIVGDFNFHIGNHQIDSTAKNFTELLESFDLTQHVNTATHKKGHVLDLLLH